MIELARVDEIAGKAAAATLNNISRVFSSPIVDLDGKDALSVTVVLKSGTAGKVKGNAAFDTIVRIGQDLNLAGDERLAVVHFATEDELAAIDDSES
jgi:hypothetical protein